MMSKTWAWMLPAAGLAVLGGLLSAAPRKPSTSEPLKEVANYSSWKRATPKTMRLPAPLDKLCRNPVGRELIQTSVNPHRQKYFNVYVNSIGEKAMMETGKQPFPVGTVIVKEKLLHEKPAKDEKPELLTVMVKREANFDEPNANWQYYIVQRNGDLIGDTKQMDHCRSCHAYQKKGDFVFRSYLPKDKETKSSKD